MTFPLYIPIGPWHVHPHALFDLLAYLVGGQVFWWMRRTGRSQKHHFEQYMWVIVGMAGGAMLGAKLLAWAEAWPAFWVHRGDLAIWTGGKTIAGGLMGGWIGVEIAKRYVHMTESTGDAVVFSLVAGIAVGRIGCFLTGLSDATYGISSTLPWAIDFGDGIRRHPTQLYEIAFLIVTGITLWQMRRLRLPNSTLFRVFMASYLLFRFAVEFLKPRDFRIISLSPIQIASFIGFAVAILSLRRLIPRPADALASEGSPT